jgi:hypothetical protein
MYKFRLIGGKHTDENHKNYKQGDIVYCPYDIRKVHANKFDLISGGPDEDEVEEPKAKVKPETVEEEDDPIVTVPLSKWPEYELVGPQSALKKSLVCKETGETVCRKKVTPVEAGRILAKLAEKAKEALEDNE